MKLVVARNNLMMEENAKAHLAALEKLEESN
jgi:hypothetical protein